MALSKENKTYWEIRAFMDGRYRFNDLYSQVKNKTCKLSKRCRDYISNMYDKPNEK